MPLWDSVQRSLEKASQEAARIAKTQRLRSIIDGVSRQINTQNNNLLNKTMDLFTRGQLTQSELLPLCQELINLQQQLNSAQAELKQLQAQASTQQPQTGGPDAYPPPGAGDLPPYLQTGEGSAQTTYAPPPEYQSYLDSTQGITVAPPPPGIETPTMSAMETIHISGGSPPDTARRCAVCQTELIPQNAFCYNCGAPVQDIDLPHSPTMRSGNMEPIYPEGHPTVQGDRDEPADLQRFSNAPPPIFTSAEEATMRANTPASVEKDEGV